MGTIQLMASRLLLSSKLNMKIRPNDMQINIKLKIGSHKDFKKPSELRLLIKV